jgi:hypothetical protein
MHVLLLFKDLGVQEVLQVLWISQTIYLLKNSYLQSLNTSFTTQHSELLNS